MLFLFHYNQKEGSANYLCLPDEPEYWNLKITGSKLLTFHDFMAPHEYEVPIKANMFMVFLVLDSACAIYDTADNTQLMIPATTYCPVGWSRLKKLLWLSYGA